jgi:hypothetical protein
VPGGVLAFAPLTVQLFQSLAALGSVALVNPDGQVLPICRNDTDEIPIQPTREGMVERFVATRQIPDLVGLPEVRELDLAQKRRFEKHDLSALYFNPRPGLRWMPIELRGDQLRIASAEAHQLGAFLAPRRFPGRAQ